MYVHYMYFVRHNLNILYINMVYCTKHIMVSIKNVQTALKNGIVSSTPFVAVISAGSNQGYSAYCMEAISR